MEPHSLCDIGNCGLKFYDMGRVTGDKSDKL